jgi:DNA modification methylase
MSKVDDGSVELVVTSPPYPMIEMWDEIMSAQNQKIADALKADNGNTAFELMHKELDKVWAEVCRVVAPGGFVCINIGDATRTIGGEFALYSNHSRIINYFVANGFVNLPNILWRKQTNAPNKFMGSGMMPAGAYVTLEHEWILIFRKGGKREFKSETEKLRRRESSFFWEERNVWFSDLWDNIKGTKQKISKSESRDRSAAYPLEIPYRLINMYSLKGDTVLDPFLGTGTTTIAAIMTGRNSIGYEIDKSFMDVIYENICSTSLLEMNAVIRNRIDRHRTFIVDRLRDNKEIKHYNGNLNMPVVTSQETEIKFSYLSNINFVGKTEVSVEYSDIAVEQVAITLPAADAATTQPRKKVVSTQIALPL